MFKIRALATLALIIGGAGKAIAQNPADYYEEIPRAFYGGLVVGANFAQVDGDNYAGYHRIGINAGGIVYTRFDEHQTWYIQYHLHLSLSYDIRHNYLHPPGRSWLLPPVRRRR